MVLFVNKLVCFYVFIKIISFLFFGEVVVVFFKRKFIENVKYVKVELFGLRRGCSVGVLFRFLGSIEAFLNLLDLVLNC